MKHQTTTPQTDGLSRRDALLLTVLASAISLAGCGGGADGGSSVAGVSSGGTGSFSTGSITGLGSIIVGGVRFDDSKASSIRDLDNDTDLRGQLKLGMVVRVKGQAKSSDGLSADADTIEVRSELLGPIGSINSTAMTMVVLGQTVKVLPTTIFEDGLAGLSALSIGDIVELHGFSEPASNSLSATRVERKRAGDVRTFKLQGAIRSLNSLAKTFSFNNLTIGFASADLGGLNLQEGLIVRVQLSTAVTGGSSTATKIRANVLESPDVNEAELEGTITTFISGNQFSVNGVPVAASGIAVPTGLALGARVEVKGSLVNGVLIARRIELENENDPLKFELNGTISALNDSSKTFVLRGVTVGYSGPVRFEDGVASNLSNVGSQAIKVKGLLSADGTRVNATEISFDR